MTMFQQQDFSATDLFDKLQAASDAELTDAPFGVVRFDEQGTVTLYNNWESGLSGLSPDGAVGRSFFEDIAPCTNNFLVAERYTDAAELDEMVNYTFTWKMNPTRVRLRMLRQGASARYLIVERR
jgi:photoactive yellow protein